MTSNLIPIEEDQITEFCENRDMKKRRKDIHKDILFFDTIAKEKYEKVYFVKLYSEYKENPEF